MKAISRALHQAVWALGLCLPAALALPVAAQESIVPAMGGNGGSPFRLECGPDSALIGVHGRVGAIIDNIEGVCQKFANGKPVGRATLTAAAGGQGGEPAGPNCADPASVVTGIGGSWGAQTYQFPGIQLQQGANLVHDIVLRCQRWNEAAGRFDTTGTISFGGRQPGTIRRTATDSVGWCPPDSVAVGLVGRSGIFIDNITLLCRPLVTVSRVTLQSDGTKRDAVGKGAGELAPKVTIIDCPAKVQAPPAIVGPAGDWSVAGWPNLRIWKVWTDNNSIICGYVTANDRASQPDTWRYTMRLPAGQRCNPDPAVPGRVLCTPAAGNTERFNYQGGQGGPPRPPPPIR